MNARLQKAVEFVNCPAEFGRIFCRNHGLYA